jgi:hypothetical protein
VSLPFFKKQDSVTTSIGGAAPQDPFCDMLARQASPSRIPPRQAGVPAPTLLLRERHGVRGDALPFAVAFHPGVGEAIRMRKCFAGFRLAGFLRDAGDNGDVRRKHSHGQIGRNGGGISVGVSFRLGEQRRLVALFTAR